MTGAVLTVLATDSEDHGLVRELIVDRLLKMGIVVAGLVLLAIGMAIVWKKTGN
ncbi:MAG: hypothetical protein ACRDQZ_17615 [Mycobacteriales bacterium]